MGAIGLPPEGEREPFEIDAVVIECSSLHAHLMPALFDIFRQQAVSQGFVDVEGINVSLKLTVSGPCMTDHDFAALSDRIDKLWLGANCYPIQRRKRETR